MLGDSVCCGDEATSIDKGFVNVWARQCEEEHDVTVQVVNRSAPGYTSAHGVTEARTILGRRHVPDLIIAAFGLNDQALRRSRIRKRWSETVIPAEYGENVGEIAYLANRQEHPCGFVAVAPLQPSRDWDLCSGDISRYTDQLRKIGCLLAEVPADWDGLLANGINHPNDAGHQIYADAVTKAVNAHLRADPRLAAR